METTFSVYNSPGARGLPLWKRGAWSLRPLSNRSRKKSVARVEDLQKVLLWCVAPFRRFPCSLKVFWFDMTLVTVAFFGKLFAFRVGLVILPVVAVRLKPMPDIGETPSGKKHKHFGPKKKYWFT